MHKLVQALAAAMIAILATLPMPAHAGTARPGLHWGPEQRLGAGHARAWVAVDVDGRATSMGVSLDDAAEARLRADHKLEVLLPLPVTAGVRSPGFGADSKLAFRVRYDARTHTQQVMLEGLPGAPTLIGAR